MPLQLGQKEKERNRGVSFFFFWSAIGTPKKKKQRQLLFGSFLLVLDVRNAEKREEREVGAIEVLLFSVSALL